MSGKGVWLRERGREKWQSPVVFSTGPLKLNRPNEKIRVKVGLKILD